MIFSVWRPDGGYDYYESSVRHGIGDDLPDAELPPAVKTLGVPAQDAGRPLPPGARKVGSGAKPRGILSPMLRLRGMGLRGVGQTTTTERVWWRDSNLYIGVAAAALLIEVLRRKKRARR